MARKLKITKNEKCILLDHMEYGKKTENHGK
ncbi:hypothetical protein T09_7889 [Trichinella sp. T9]|nr:hypothetical protein T09_7889 [Trichinella sp. T9]